MFYHFNQNNSGGWCHNDEDLCHHVIIEAENAAEANELAESIGIGTDEDTRSLVVY